jgi:hypothetical protein
MCLQYAAVVISLLALIVSIATFVLRWQEGLMTQAIWSIDFDKKRGGEGKWEV